MAADTTPATVEDKRAAVAIEASLSSYLMTAVLAIIGAQAVIIGLVLDKKEHLMVFSILSVAAFICLLSSFYFGGRGIAELYKEGYDGKWTIQTKGFKFNKQTFLALAGTACVLASVFCGRPKADDFRTELLSAKSDAAATKERLQVLDAEVAQLRSSLGTVCQIRPAEPPADKKLDKKLRNENPPKAEQKD